MTLFARDAPNAPSVQDGRFEIERRELEIADGKMGYVLWGGSSGRVVSILGLSSLGWARSRLLALALCWDGCDDGCGCGD